MPDIGGHRGYVSGAHDDLGPQGAGFPVRHIPVDLIRQLDEPLDPIIAMDDREDVLLGCRTEQAVFADRHHRRVPGHIRSRQVGEKAESLDLVLEPRLSDDLWLVLGDIDEVLVDGVSGFVRSDLLITGAADHSGCLDTVTGNGLTVFPVLDAKGAARFAGRGKGIECHVGPIVEHLLEGRFDLRCREVLDMIQFRFAV